MKRPSILFGANVFVTLKITSMVLYDAGRVEATQLGHHTHDVTIRLFKYFLVVVIIGADTLVCDAII